MLASVAVRYCTAIKVLGALMKHQLRCISMGSPLSLPHHLHHEVGRSRIWRPLRKVFLFLSTLLSYARDVKASVAVLSSLHMLHSHVRA